MKHFDLMKIEKVLLVNFTFFLKILKKNNYTIIFLKGGYSPSGRLTSVELWSGTEFEFSFTLPIAVDGHCLDKINSTHGILDGGWR